MGLAPILSQRQSLRVGGRLLDALQILGMSAPDLTEHLRRCAEANTCLSVRAPSGSRGRDDDALASLAAAPPSLLAHVTGQIELGFRDAVERRVALAFADALEPTGWLGQDVASIAGEAGVPVATAAAVLARLRRLDPPGVFASSLAECLLPQAEAADILTWEIEALIRNLHLLGEGRIADLAELCDCDPRDIPGLVRQVRGLDPKPGLAFEDWRPATAPPDLVLRRDGADWSVELNRATAPRVAVRAPAGGGLHRPGRTRDLAEARALAQAVARRGETLVRIATTLVARQRGLLEQGPVRRAPLRLGDVASELGLHASTISRAVAGRRIQTPARVLPLRDFFCRAVRGADGTADRSRDGALDFVRSAIRGEDPARPLSDAALAALARADGLVLARRSVARYRGLLGLGTACDRRGGAAVGR